MKNFRALALFSGGLDSMLSIKLISDQGIDVVAINMNIGFGSKKNMSEIMKKRAQKAGATFKMVDVRELYLKDILFDPKFGYGKHFNPCIDCHGFMFRSAKRLLKEYDADFLITGEVLGQRPMSQRADALQSVKNLAEDEDNLILRPMCAKLLEPTKPEIEGWVDREKLLGISGRSREVQISLAQKFGWDDYEKPGGGCLLTDKYFSQKMSDFVKYDKFEVEDIQLIKFGRHLRLPDSAKLVIGRDKEENEILENIKNSKMEFIKLKEIAGPLSLISKNATKADRILAAKIILTFTKANKNEEYDVVFEKETVKVSPFENRSKAMEYYV
jgi:tRNA-specific 2-thiouridylase